MTSVLMKALRSPAVYLGAAALGTTQSTSSTPLLTRAFCAAAVPTPPNQPSAKDVANLRVSYNNQGLLEEDIGKDPYEQFKVWFAEACDAKVIEPNAMCLSTCKDNIPTARYVLLKAHDERGYVWYTNYTSRKSQDLMANPHAAITFWWGDLERSVRIEGTVEKVSEQESDEYFNSRPRGSRIGAWSSNQSSTIGSREELEQQEKDIIANFGDGEDIPRPPHWGGFRLVPSRVEFWKGRASRLHDRLMFERTASGEWENVKRLQP